MRSEFSADGRKNTFVRPMRQSLVGTAAFTWLLDSSDSTCARALVVSLPSTSRRHCRGRDLSDDTAENRAKKSRNETRHGNDRLRN
jgi:hypothetical protein